MRFSGIYGREENPTVYGAGFRLPFTPCQRSYLASEENLWLGSFGLSIFNNRTSGSS